MTDQSGFRRLRLDGGLTGFRDVLGLFLSTGERAPTSKKKIVAKWTYMPAEPILAAGALPYDPHITESLRHLITDEDTSSMKYAVESGLPPDYCPWNLAMAGSMMSGKTMVPIDLMVVSCGCWCDSMSQSWYSTSRRIGIPFHYFDVPPFDLESKEWAIEYLVKELESLSEWLGNHGGRRIEGVALREEIRSTNKLRQAMIDLTDLLREDNVPVSALEYYLLQMTMSDYLQAPDALYRAWRGVLQESKERVRKGTPAKSICDSPLRVYYSGAETQELSVFSMIEDFGGTLVGCDTYLPLYRDLVSEDGSLRSLANWIWATPFSFPTMERIRATMPFIKKQRAECVMINNTTGCKYLTESSRLARDMIREELGLPVLTVETSSPGENVELTESRIRAFMETNR